MATQPHPTAPPPKPAPPQPEPPKPERGKGKDPQEVKDELVAAPPTWTKPPQPKPLPEAWEPDPAMNPREQKPPEGYYADGMTIVDEQRARSAWLEEHGLKEWLEEVDDRPKDEQPKFDKDALTHGAYVAKDGGKQVPGVAAPAARRV